MALRSLHDAQSLVRQTGSLPKSLASVHAVLCKYFTIVPAKMAGENMSVLWSGPYADTDESRHAHVHKKHINTCVHE